MEAVLMILNKFSAPTEVLGFELILTKRVMIGLVALVLVFIFLELWAVNRLTSLGGQLEKIESSKTALQLENAQLKNEIDRGLSMQRATGMAQSLGFTEIKNVDYLLPPNLALGN